MYRVSHRQWTEMFARIFHSLIFCALDKTEKRLFPVVCPTAAYCYKFPGDFVTLFFSLEGDEESDGGKKVTSHRESEKWRQTFDIKTKSIAGKLSFSICISSHPHLNHSLHSVLNKKLWK
jgi:hypothetical protein